MQLKNNNIKADQNIRNNNTAQFTKLAAMKRVEGVNLSDSEKEYLLPHFLMLLVGKPGSGKTTMIKHLVMDREFYRGRFDSIIVISPSHSKIGLPLNAQDCASEFNLKWIYEGLDRVNKRQQNKLERIVSEQMKQTSETIEGQDHIALLRAVTKENAGQSSLASVSNTLATKSRDIAMYSGLTSKGNDGYVRESLQFGGFNQPFSLKKSRFGKSLRGEVQLQSQMTRMQNNLGNNVNDHRRQQNKPFTKKQSKISFPQGGYKVDQSGDFFTNFISNVSNLDKKILNLLSDEQIEKHRCNVLIILDDVVGPIKALQNDQYLAQLFFNRRHLIANGTVSVMLVTQKYTMIPARIRSQIRQISITFFKMHLLDHLKDGKNYLDLFLEMKIKILKILQNKGKIRTLIILVYGQKLILILVIFNKSQ